MRNIHSKSYILFLVLVFSIFAVLPAETAGQKPFPEPLGLVNDFAGVISTEHKRKIDTVASDLLRSTGVALVVVTMPDIGGEEYNDYANRLYSAWGVGKKGEDKGILIFITIKERKMRIETGYGVEGIIPDGLAGEIRDKYMLPYLKQDKFGEGLLNGALAVAGIIADDAGVSFGGGAPVEAPRERGGAGLSLAPLLFFIIFLFAMFRRRRGGLLLPLLLLGGMRSRSGGIGSRGGFGGFSGGFGGFGGGMSGGGGAGGSF
jgi:uncharacterized protein